MGPATGTTADEPFLALLAASDLRGAAEWLVDRYASEVLALCTAMARDRTVAEDLTQEVFGRAFVSLEGFRGDASSRTWLLAIARNRCIDFLRARRRDPWAGALGDESLEPDLQPDEAPLPPDLLSRRDEVEAALAALSEGERALVVLRFSHGLDYGELARAFGLRPGTVRMRVSRALGRMRAALEAFPTELSEDLSEADFDLVDATVSSSGFAPDPMDVPARPTPPAPGRPLEVPDLLTSASAPASTTRTRAGVLRMLFGGAPRRPAAPAPAAPPPHPLARFFAAVEQGVPTSLRFSLLESARAL